MAQNITIMGASYSDVPAVQLPKTGGGTARFDDASITTATASDVLQGKLFLSADGTITTGTASGGGASNYVSGEFNTGSSMGKDLSIDIPYTGAGYPIAAMVFIKGGPFDNDSEWYNAIHRYAVGVWSMAKAAISDTPTYTTSEQKNYGTIAVIYKNSTSSATQYSRNTSMSAFVFASASATASVSTCIRFMSATRLSVFVSAASYGLLANMDYEYHIVYSE